MDDRVLALCEISKDLLFEKIPKDRLAYYVDSSLLAGRNAAEGLAGRDIGGLYREHGIAVAKRPPVKSPFGVALRGMATMSPKGCTVEIYEESIADMARWCGMDQDLAERIHLAHEFFHFLEYQRRPFFLEKLEPVVTARLLGYARKAAINRCSEAAAHAFAKTLLGLERLPNYYDYVYLIAIGKMTQEAFEEKLGLYADMLGGAAGPPSG